MLENCTPENIILFSQYPQYSCSTSGNALRLAIKQLKAHHKQIGDSTLAVIDRWFDHPGYIESMARLIYEGLIEKLDEE